MYQDSKLERARSVFDSMPRFKVPLVEVVNSK